MHKGDPKRDFPLLHGTFKTDIRFFYQKCMYDYFFKILNKTDNCPILIQK